MENLKSVDQNDDGEEFFCDAFDEFPFYDCSEAFCEPAESHADVSSSISVVTLNSKLSPERLSPANLRRHTSSVGSREDGGVSSSISFDKSYVNSEAEKFEFLPEFDENGEKDAILAGNLENPDGTKLKLSSESQENGEFEGFNEVNKDNSTITDVHYERVDDYVEVESSLREIRDENSSFLIILAGLVIRAIGFQFNLVINFFMFPLWLIYSSYMFVMDPFRVMDRVRKRLIRNAKRICLCGCGKMLAFVKEWFKDYASLLTLGLKFGWGLLWSVYVCVVLVGLLVSAFVVGGILMRILVEEPIRMKENLNFDYTEKSPLAFVPIVACPGGDCVLGLSEKSEVAKLGGVRVIPSQHKLQVTVSLALPESDYNRNLGIFQVRVDFLAADGKVLASSMRPRMLHFKSEPIRLLLTFLQVAPLLTGYKSESQDLHIKFSGFTEGGIPTACLRVIIEQRAQFQPGAGIPEIYSASLTLESEQPLLKRIVWYWRRTLFVWISMTMFFMELLFTLLCCKPIIIPRVKLGNNSSSNGSAENAGRTRR